jgi:hypothetical protein
VQKKLYFRHLCRTFVYRIDLFVFMHNKYIAFKAKLRLVKVFLHICLSANAFFGLKYFLFSATISLDYLNTLTYDLIK